MIMYNSTDLGLINDVLKSINKNIKPFNGKCVGALLKFDDVKNNWTQVDIFEDDYARTVYKKPHWEATEHVTKSPNKFHLKMKSSASVPLTDKLENDKEEDGRDADEELHEDFRKITIKTSATISPMLIANNNDVKKWFDSRIKKKSDIYVQLKLNGTRAVVYVNEGKVQIKTRGNTEITPHRRIVDDLSILDNGIYDCEFYGHGIPLQELITYCRTGNRIDDNPAIKLYCFDIIDTTLTFEERLNKLDKIENNNNSFVIVKTVNYDSWENILKLMSENKDYEGLILRDSTGMYKPSHNNSRSSSLVKLKHVQDDEFELISQEEIVDGKMNGLFVPIFKTKDGKTFKSNLKDVNMQERGVLDMSKLYGKMIRIYYDELSKDGIPKCPRTSLEYEF